MKIIKINWLYSLYLNVRLFGICNALFFPLIVGYRVKVHLSKQAKIEINECKFGIVSIGVSSGSLGMGRGTTTSIYMGRNSKFIAHGNIVICKKSYIDIEQNAVLEFGNNFSANAGLKIKCGKSISFGDNCIVGWNSSFIDKDGHTVSKEGNLIETVLPIYIGNHVWIGADVAVLKGVVLQNNVLVGAKSVVTRQTYYENCSYAGNPAKLISSNIDWEF